MSKAGAPERLIIGDKRLDGRSFGQFREFVAETGIVGHANGSGKFEFGGTKAIAAVHGPRTMHPRWMQKPEKSVLRCKYNMMPFSTKDRIRPGRSRRSTEISKVVTEALTNVLFLEDFPKTAIDAFIGIVQADASTRCAGLNAAALALADAGIPMRDLVSSCSVGKIDGELVMDMDGVEDNFGEVDLATATVGGSDRFVLLQLDGIITKEQFFKGLEMARDGCAEVYKKQIEALKSKYTTEGR